MTTQPSQTALYGEVLTSEQHYAVEVNQIPRLTQEQEMEIWEQIRQGDSSGKERLLLSLLHYVKRVAMTLYEASRWSAPHLDYLDIVQEGNQALFEHFEAALEKPNPTGYLLTCAKFAMRDYCHRFQRAISTPIRETPLPVASLDRPLHPEEKRPCTLADFLPDPHAGCLMAEPDEPDEELYQAIALLPPIQREVIERSFGLNGHAAELDCEINRQKGVCEQYAYAMKRKALHKLRLFLKEPKGSCGVYSKEQACQRLNVSVRAFRLLMYRNKIRCVRHRYYRKEDIERVAQQREQRQARRAQKSSQHTVMSCQTEGMAS